MVAFDALELAIGHSFIDKSLLTTALTHRSYAHEHGGEHNERLEWLGDALLNAATTLLLMDRFPNQREGSLSQLRAKLVNTVTLADIAHTLGLGQWLRLGRGEQDSGGRTKPKLLADATEALVGALYQDVQRQGGQAFAVCGTLVGVWMTTRIDVLDDGTHKRGSRWKNARSLLQELTQQHWQQLPKYRVVHRRGPAHDPTFQVAATVGERVLGMGRGPSKKEAQNQAALAAIDTLRNEGLA